MIGHELTDLRTNDRRDSDLAQEYFVADKIMLSCNKKAFPDPRARLQKHRIELSVNPNI